MAEAALSLVLCPGCGSELSPNLLTCPSCHRLVHSDELKRLAGEAEAAATRGAFPEALAGWRRALELLPAGSSQHARITERVKALSEKVDGQGAAAGTPGKSAGKAGASGIPKVLGGLGAVGLLLWKLKAVVLFVATKAKVLLLGLTKASTLLSMLLSLGVYWQVWGWQLALGLVLCIYVHEMGHVVALRRFGIAASAPMFIPGLGAVIRAKQVPVDAREDARVGLAGPIWGTGAVLVALAAVALTGWKMLGAIAHVGAWINLFNLLPFWQLDGSRGFRAMSRGQRWAAVAVLASAWFLSGDGLLVLILLVAGFRAFGSDAPEKGDVRAAAEYCGLVWVLTLLAWGIPRWFGLPGIGG
ncbi:MAG: hypothetical protein L0Y66_06810 [Myxococcaceae bacterium]|nr:hypothetical protein [Myxococcaceae bacterium]